MTHRNDTSPAPTTAPRRCVTSGLAFKGPGWVGAQGARSAPLRLSTGNGVGCLGTFQPGDALAKLDDAGFDARHAGLDSGHGCVEMLEGLRHDRRPFLRGGPV